MCNFEFWSKPNQMLRITEHFSKDCSCHIQGERVTAGSFGSIFQGRQWMETCHLLTACQCDGHGLLY